MQALHTDAPGLGRSRFWVFVQLKQWTVLNFQKLSVVRNLVQVEEFRMYVVIGLTNLTILFLYFHKNPKKYFVPSVGIEPTF